MDTVDLLHSAEDALGFVEHALSQTPPDVAGALAHLADYCRCDPDDVLDEGGCILDECGCPCHNR